MNFQILTHKVVRVSQHHVFASKSGNKQTDLMLPVFSVLQRASSLKVCRGSYWGSSGARKCSAYRAGAAFCCTSYSEAFHLHFLPEVKLRGRIDERSEPPGGISVSWKLVMYIFISIKTILKSFQANVTRSYCYNYLNRSWYTCLTAPELASLSVRAAAPFLCHGPVFTERPLRRRGQTNTVKTVQ